MWGQVNKWQLLRSKTRIIPTRVGTSERIFIRPLTAIGSSPRVWGQEALNLYSVLPIRNIPTRVGTRPSSDPIPEPKTDHPHACGDKYQVSVEFFAISGSSPRVWGQVYHIIEKIVYIRIIPTRVGTRVSSTASGFEERDHPHACGDKLYSTFVKTV